MYGRENGVKKRGLLLRGGKRGERKKRGKKGEWKGSPRCPQPLTPSATYDD